MPALTSLSSKINNTIHPRCNLSFSNYCLDKRVHLTYELNDLNAINALNEMDIRILKV